MTRVIAFGILACFMFAASVGAHAKEKSMTAFVQLTGDVFLVVVMFAHVSEVFGFIPSFGWGQPNTVGHYIDLVSAIAGSILLQLGYLSRRYTKGTNSS